MKAIKPILVFAVKKYLLLQDKKDVKELFLERLAEDSKELGLIILAINFSAITFMISTFGILFFTFTEANQTVPESIAYSASILMTLTIVIMGYCFFFLNKKITLYKNISEIQQEVRSFSWLSPLFDQLAFEHKKMKRKLDKTQHREKNGKKRKKNYSSQRLL